jgi:hypothetical protein
LEHVLGDVAAPHAALEEGEEDTMILDEDVGDLSTKGSLGALVVLRFGSRVAHGLSPADTLG